MDLAFFIGQFFDLSLRKGSSIRSFESEQNIRIGKNQSNGSKCLQCQPSQCVSSFPAISRNQGQSIRHRLLHVRCLPTRSLHAFDSHSHRTQQQSKLNRNPGLA